MKDIEKFFYNWYDEFLEELDINEKNDLTYSNYDRIISYFIEYIISENTINTIEEIDHRLINRFIKYREERAKVLKNKDKGFEYKTKTLYKTVLKLYLDFIEDESDDKYNFNIKWKRLSFKKTTKEKTHINEDNENTILQYLSNLIVRATKVIDWKEINKIQRRELKNLEYVYMLNFTFKLGIYMGLRVSEICSLKLKDISKPYMTNSNQQLVDVLIQGKGSKERLLPVIYKRIKKEHIFFKKIRKGNDVLFHQINGKDLTRTSLYNYFKEVGRFSKTGEKGCHILRHTFTYKMSEAGIDIGDAQDMLGHSDVSTTRIYFKRNSTRMRNVASKI
ncbi:MAG: site-specific integrase [Campylobacterota bacterium]|nr:site-specific integrase [Campylobacterota bacterium]